MRIRRVLTAILLALSALVAMSLRTAPISATLVITSDYTFTGDIYEPIVVAADNIVIDGNGYTLDGPGYDTGFRFQYGRSGVTIKNVVVKDWTYGIHLDGYCSGNSIIGNTVTNNGAGIRVKSLSDDNLISANIISNNAQGISIRISLRNDVSDNTITSNSRGIGISGCALVSVVDNMVSNNAEGIYLCDNSVDITVSDNKISENTYGITLIDNVRWSIIRSNTLSTNSVGIYIYLSRGNNKLYHNRFINNEQQTLCRSTANYWDDGYPSGGNYWSNYAGIDEYSGPNQDIPGSDGIGDTPYNVANLGVDHYPLMGKHVAKTSLEDQRTIIESWNLDAGFERQLTSKVNDAIKLVENGNLNGAEHKLGDLIKKVTNDAKYLTLEQKDYIIQETQEVIDLIACMH